MRRRRKKGTGIGIIAFVVLMLCAVISYSRINLVKEKQQAELKISRLDAKYQEEQQRTEDINEFRAYTKTKQYIEETAREKLGLVYEDEILFEAEDK